MALKRKDSDIHQDVLQELKWDTRVDETEVGVEVDSGVVTLTGTVSSLAKKIAAQAAAHRVFGVLDVANDITVKVAGSLVRTDTEIAQAVRRALEWDVFVPEEQITSTVENGWVTLEGTVDLWAQREDAERTLRNLGGVRGVTNRITVIRRAVSEDLRKAIEEALKRRAEREANRINIETSGDGKVTLTGAVRTFADRQAVLGIVLHAPGVRDVDDRLRIDPYS